MTLQLCICEQCHHAWLGKDYPERCPKCRRRGWDGQEIPRQEPVFEIQKGVVVKSVEPFAGMATDYVPVREMSPDEIREKYPDPEEQKTFQKSLCRHGLYKALCKRCA